MKFCYLFNSFAPSHKCGESLLFAAQGLGGFAGNVYSQEVNSRNVQKQINAQKEENALNRDWQTSQAEIARQFVYDQTRQQNQFQTQLATQQQNYNLQSMREQARLNSPVYQSQELSAARINPQVYFGNHGSFSGSSAVAGGAPSAPGVGSAPNVGSVSGLSPVGFQPSFLNPADLFKSIGEGLKALGEAKRSGIETRFLEQSFESRLREAIASGDMAVITQQLQALDLKFQEANFPTRFKKAYADYKETLSRIDLLKQQALTEQEEQSLKRATAEMNKAISALTDKDRERLGITVQWLPQLLQSEILRNKGQASQSYASARESNANAYVLSQEGRLRKVVADIRETGKTAELESVINDFVAKKAISRQQYQSAMNSLVKLKAISKAYDKSENKVAVDAVLEDFFKTIGLNVSASVHN